MEQIGGEELETVCLYCRVLFTVVQFKLPEATSGLKDDAARLQIQFWQAFFFKQNCGYFIQLNRSDKTSRDKSKPNYSTCTRVHHEIFNCKLQFS